MLYAAGSLREALTEVAGAFEAAGGVMVLSKFGPSGLLKDQILAGTRVDVFASADLGNPRALAAAKRALPAMLFARNRLCVLARPGLEVTPASLLARLTDPALKLGTSTPGADPSGDYAWAMFRKADALKPGAYATLDKKALKLVGGATSPPGPPGRAITGVLLEQRVVDLFVAYCTAAQTAQRENPALQVVVPPEGLAVGADYGLTVMASAPVAAHRLALFILSEDGQAILARHGFTPAAVTTP
jgi:ABC-type molybdate transport system substrate-binding protein